MKSTDLKQHKVLTGFLLSCLVIILASTLYVAWIAYHEPKSTSVFGKEEFSQLLENASKAVVAISTTQKSSPSRVPLSHAGSGFFFDPTGLILTNEHVIHNSKEIRITLADKRQYIAQLIAADARTDLAVLKIDAQNLNHLTITPIESLSPASIIIALGNPLGTASDGQAVATFGQINRLNQRLDLAIDRNNDRFYDNLIQTNAVTLEGSSGGPLIDITGRIIGINTAMGTALRSAEHFGFAITLDQKTIDKINLLKQGRPVRHAFLGVDTAKVDQNTKERLNLKDLSGVLVKNAMLGSPAQKQGIRPNDVITHINDRFVRLPEDLISAVENHLPGQVVKVNLRRLNIPNPITLDVRLTQRSLPDLKGYIQEVAQPSLVAEKWGMTVIPLTKWRRQKMNLTPRTTGVLVYHVSPGSPADSQNIQPGNIITHIARYQIHTIKDFYNLAVKYPNLPPLTQLRP